METTKTKRAQVCATHDQKMSGKAQICATPNRDTVACDPDRVIYLSDAGKVKLRQLFRTSRITVWKALTYKTHSAMARKIRHVALTQLGGTPSRWMPDCETGHTNDLMTQTWADGRVRLDFSKTSGNVVLFVLGRKEKEVKNISHLDFIALQQEAELKALTL